MIMVATEDCFTKWIKLNFEHIILLLFIRRNQKIRRKGEACPSLYQHFLKRHLFFAEFKTTYLFPFTIVLFRLILVYQFFYNSEATDDIMHQ